ncbi:recombinase family protein [Planktothrix sp. FACHB-1355]|uniref:Recombinase family protein n=1 Tax=Aerosakkonema funiforme FACHB-1375 TaxID=2949571 RepID=A0A926VM09_9CYAN|nr:recombinase family protein [Aerosakkonema funiforme FACHB-1375]MBD3562487.1 recombinase family protein [Planktothrix sp. FACHB-1355]
MVSESIWIAGSSRGGKTTRLIEQFCTWVQMGFDRPNATMPNSATQGRAVSQSVVSRLTARQRASAALIFAANGDNRIELTDRITAAIPNIPIRTTTPLAFFEDEVILFWPLLIQRLNLKAQFPLRLRPETEQELATELWRPELDMGIWRQMGVNEYRLVRRALDLLLLAGLSGTPPEDISEILEQGLVEEGEGESFDSELSSQHSTLKMMLLRWKQWCLERGLLTYGIIAELYWRYLLPDATYQQHLTRRCRIVLADDIDDYPAIARDLFDFLLDSGAIGAFAYNPEGGVRVGLGADSDFMAGLASRCQVDTLRRRPVICLEDSLGNNLVEALNDPSLLSALPESVQSLQTISRSQLLRETAEIISQAINSGQVQPQDVAVIAPGLDAIARYSFIEILTGKGIAVESLNDQRPLSSSPIVRALLTLLALVYPGLGRLVDRDAIAEMLVVLSQSSAATDNEESEDTSIPNPKSQIPKGIDPVRAGLLADYCYAPDPELPSLQPVKSFARWDRLGYQATIAYEEIVQWLEEQRSQQQQRLIPSGVHVLDRAIQRFLWNGSYLPFHQLSALRELMETAQHYWEVDGRLRKTPIDSPVNPGDTPSHTTVGRFIQLLRRGTVTANPFPMRSFGRTANAVTLANIFQYRSSRRFHRWQFWMDVGSSLWLSGGAASLFASQLFLQNRLGEPWTEQDETDAGEERLRRIVRDLLSRAGERIYLCHSDFAVNGQEQNGPLLTLVNASVPVNSEALLTQT